LITEIFNTDINVVYQYIGYVTGIPCRVFQAKLDVLSP